MNSDSVLMSIPPPSYNEAMNGDAAPHSSHQDSEALLGVKSNEEKAEEEKRKKLE